MMLLEHAIEVKYLVKLAYAELPYEYRNRMALEKFSSTLRDAYLQKHLQTLEAHIVEDAVQDRNEFLEKGPGFQ